MISNEAEIARTSRHEDLCQAISAGIVAAQPQTVLAESLALEDGVLTVAERSYRLEEYDDVVVLGGGNAAGAVATALEELLGEQIDGGLVVTDDPAPTERIEVVEGTHPLPSQANVDGTRRLLDRAGELQADDLVLTVISGGGSALMCAPTAGVSLSDYRELTTGLLESGASIDEINAVRKHLSALKGGQLARELAPATTVGLVFSDVVGNRLDVIASGPISPDETTYGDAVAVLDRYSLDPPESIVKVLEEGSAGERPETPGTEDAAFNAVQTFVLADNRTALEASAAQLAGSGYRPVILSAEVTGEANDVGQVHGAIARECAKRASPFEPPVALLSGGETTVTVSGDGTGGPNQEFALATALELLGTDAIVGAVDTDGIDGPTDAAGALLDEDSLGEPGKAQSALDANDVFPYLAECEALIRTGRTGTNVNDLRIVLVGIPE